MEEDNQSLTREQQELLYLIAKITDSANCPYTWIKETPLQALIFHGIRKGVFNDYDYAPISSPFLGQGRKFVNISKEGDDDLGDLRELGLLETIRLSSSKHNYITGYRPTKESHSVVNEINIDIKQRIDKLFYCETCKTNALNLDIDVEESEFNMLCKNCLEKEYIPLAIPEDVSYTTKAYFFHSIEKIKKKSGDRE